METIIKPFELDEVIPNVELNSSTYIRKTVSTKSLGFITLLMTALTLASAPHTAAQTVFFSDNFGRPDSTNMDVSASGMTGVIISSGVLTVGNANNSPWYVPSDFAFNNPSNACVTGNLVRLGGFGHSVFLYPNFNFASLVATGIVSIQLTLTNHAPQGGATGTNAYDRYVGIGVGFSLAAGSALTAVNADRFMISSNDLFVDESANGYLNIYDGPAAGRATGANVNYARNFANGWVNGTLRIDLFVTNTSAGSPVAYNVLWNGGNGFTNLVTGRSFTLSGSSGGQLCAGMEERSTLPVTNAFFSISSSSYSPPPVTGLTWRATTDNNWNTTSVDWVDSGSGLSSDAFFTGANVTFNDNTANATVNVQGLVTPGNLIFNNANSNYLLLGTGSIGGTGSLTMLGTGTLTLNLNNTYSGGTILGAGRIRLGSNNGLGNGFLTFNGGALSAAGPAAITLTNALTIKGNTTFGDATDNGRFTLSNSVDFSGGSSTLTINSDTVFAGGATDGDIGSKVGTGTLIINGICNFTGSQDVQNGTVIYDGATVTSSDRIIADTAVVNGIARLVITNGSRVINTIAVGNLRSGRLASLGTNYVDLAGFYSIPNADAADGYVTLREQPVGLEITFWPGGDFIARGVTNVGGVGNTVFNFNGGILRARNNNPNYFGGISQALVQTGGANIDDGGFAITIKQNLLDGGGGGGLTKIGAGTLTLNSANTYTGGTVVSNGILNITGSLTGNGSVQVVAGTLSGSGTIAGSVVIQTGGTLSPGAVIGAPTTLTLQNNLTLTGNLQIEVNKSLAVSNDVVNVVGTLNNVGTGTLTLVNSGPAYAAGDRFYLFNQPLVNGGGLTLSLATPGNGLAWSNELSVNGSITVVATGISGPPADLSSLTVNTLYATSPLTPTFVSNIVNYSTSLAYTNTAVTVAPVSVDTNATIRIILRGVTNLVASAATSVPISLDPGTNVIDVNVTTSNGQAVEDYFVNVTRTQPNIVVILADDQGFSDWSCYGSEIPTPNLDSLAANGLRFRNFYNAARCSPTRCSLLTGLYTQQAATVPSASLPPLRANNNLTIAEFLKSIGYHTYMAGKWHLGNIPDQLPENRGFQEVFTYINGNDHSENEWDPTKYRFASTDGETTNISYLPGVPITTGSFYQPDANR